MASLPEHPAAEIRRILHQLNNLLAVLHGHAEALSRDTEKTSPRRRHVEGLFDVLTRSNEELRNLAQCIGVEKSEETATALVGPEELKGVETVLFVEDEAALRGITSRFLGMNGYKVIETSSADEALKRFQDAEDVIDILVTDLTLHGMDGVELSRRILARRPDMKILFLSGHGEAEMRRRVGNVASANLLPKPFRPKDLVQRLRLILDDKKVSDA
jgi:CheY-like chemotaxis protein